MNAPDEHVMQLSGRLTLDVITGLFKQGLQKTARGDTLTIDFAKVEGVDSSAVSLLLAWLRTAQREGFKLAFTHVPDNLTSLANLYGVAETLSLRLSDQ